jgi:hypothetical protein
MKVRLRVKRLVTSRPTLLGVSVQMHGVGIPESEGGYEEGEDACVRSRGAAGITIGCQDIAHELGIATSPARIYTYRGSRGHQ